MEIFKVICRFYIIFWKEFQITSTTTKKKKKKKREKKKKIRKIVSKVKFILENPLHTADFTDFILEFI